MNDRPHVLYPTVKYGLPTNRPEPLPVAALTQVKYTNAFERYGLAPACTNNALTWASLVIVSAVHP